jgi:YjjG family noncanonical pyrimidine nucleotidase
VPYDTVLLDLDHTLLDSDDSEHQAFVAAMRAAGAADPTEHLAAYTTINGALWAAVERGELTPNDVKVARFERLIDRQGLDADATTIAQVFVGSLGANGDLYPGARRLLDRLSNIAVLALVTNGLGEVQRTRLARLDLERYFDAVVISGEVGTAKPGAAIFDLTFERLGRPDRMGALMVGDSLTSDIRGGADYGIATCWYNPGGASSNGVVATYEVASLAEIEKIVERGPDG